MDKLQNSESTLLLHFQKGKNEAVADILNELHRDYLSAINSWAADPTMTVVGNSMLAKLFSKMGCEIHEYDKDGYYIIEMPHTELM